MHTFFEMNANWKFDDWMVHNNINDMQQNLYNEKYLEILFEFIVLTLQN